MNDEERLIRQFIVNNDEEAFESLIRRSLPSLRRLIAASGPRDPEDRKDVLQEVLIRLHRSLGTFLFKSSFTTWAFRITRNVTLDMERKKRRARYRERMAAWGRPEESEKSADPESMALNAEQESELKNLFYCLGERDRQLLLLRERENLSMEEISTILQVPVGTAKSRLSRARIKARRLYEESSYEESK